MDFDEKRMAAVVSREDSRFEFVDEQAWDTSCGYSALASLLRLYRGKSTTEIQLMTQTSEREPPVREVSLATLARLARARGLAVWSWKSDWNGLLVVAGRGAPVLVHYHRPQGHFALVLSAGERGVVTADPARGLELLTRWQFLERWSGSVVEVLDLAQPHQGSERLQRALQTVDRRQELTEWALASRP